MTEKSLNCKEKVKAKNNFETAATLKRDLRLIGIEN
jgi:hypothetical protein